MRSALAAILVRAAIVVALLASLFAFVHTDSAPKPGLDPAKPEDFVTRIHHIIGGGGACRGCVMNLQAWQAEILPWFIEEGIVETTAPVKSVWRFHTDDRANHVLGQCDCAGHVWMNARYVNPVSPWFMQASFLATFTHELVHSQQLTACETNAREKVETTAQIVSLEIMAAMANNGNRVAAYALLDELEGIALSEMRFQSLTDSSKSRRLNRLIRRLFDPWEMAERQQRWRYWNGPGLPERDFVLRAYAHDPYVLLLKALDTGHLDGLALQPQFRSYVYPPERYVPRVTFNDLRYFLQHAESLVRNS
jgi:hypothetical protein